MSEAKSAPMVVVFPRGQLMPKDKERLTKVGIIAVEADDPKQVQQLHLAAPLINTAINGDLIVRAALAAIAEQAPETNGGSITGVGHAAHTFVKRLSVGLDWKAVTERTSAYGTSNDQSKEPK